MVMEGADPTSLLFIPAIILVIVATFGAAMSSQTMDDLKKLPAWFKMAVMPAKVPPATEQIQTLVSLAEKARKEGLLALEAQVKQIEDPFLRRGLDRKSTRLNSSHANISYAVFCLKKEHRHTQT